MTDYVWYVAYGSNLDSDRFSCYLSGGTPVGSSHAHRGSIDPAPPVDSRPVDIGHDLFFACPQPTQWGRGGIAFLDHASDGYAYGRAYLITVRQFEDVLAQENGTVHHPVRELHAPPGTVRHRSHRRYDTLLHLPAIDGLPALTFTGPWSRHDQVLAAPAPAYRAVIRSGLIATHGLTAEQADAYLDVCSTD